MPPRRPTRFRRLINRLALLATMVVLVAYPVDWLIWQLLRVAGKGAGTIPVTETTAASLKGNHFEVYSSQVEIVSCSHSLFPEGGARPCWWLRQHPQVVSQY